MLHNSPKKWSKIIYIHLCVCVCIYIYVCVCVCVLKVFKILKNLIFMYYVSFSFSIFPPSIGSMNLKMKGKKEKKRTLIVAKVGYTVSGKFELKGGVKKLH